MHIVPRPKGRAPSVEDVGALLQNQTAYRASDGPAGGRSTETSIGAGPLLTCTMRPGPLPALPFTFSTATAAPPRSTPTLPARHAASATSMTRGAEYSDTFPASS